MPPGAADVLDIRLRARHAQAALHRHRARRRRRHFAEERGHERLHPGDREERGRHRIGDERDRGDVFMTALDEVVDERCGDPVVALRHATLHQVAFGTFFGV